MEIPTQKFKTYFDLIDQLFEIERKLENIQESNSIARNLNKMKNIFENLSSESDAGLIYHNPVGEAYNETRTDLEASISGNSTEDLIVKEVIKPIIRYRTGGASLIVRKGVVIVESKN